MAAAIGYFQADDAPPAAIAAENLRAIERFAGGRADVSLAVKAPPMGFDIALLDTLSAAAAAANIPLLFDAHAPDLAEPTLRLVERLLPANPGTGFALPARWRRSMADAARFRDTAARIRLVKGEWPDPTDTGIDPASNFRRLAAFLAGRRAPVAVATHDPELAHDALSILRASGTPCELEQLRGLPRRRTVAVANRLGVPIRIYLPYGPGWWPYAIDRALGRPYLLSWALRDRFGALHECSESLPSIG